MSVDVDVSELITLAVDLERIPAKVIQGMRPVISKGALNIKTEMQRDMRESGHFGQIAPSISYDLTASGDGVEAQIGPDKGRAGGALANIAYFGTSRGGGTVPDPLEALATESENVIEYLGKLVEGSL